MTILNRLHDLIIPEAPVAVQLARDPNKPYKFSSTQINLPEHLAKRIREMASHIHDEDLADDGREAEPHTTVKYGLHLDSPDELARLVSNFGPVRVKLGNVSLFPANEKQTQRGGDQYDVVKVDVESPDLHRLNKLISDHLPHTDTHPDYKPHITIAYVKPGVGKRYVGQPVGGEFTANSFLFAPRDRSGKVEVPLTGRQQSDRPRLNHKWRYEHEQPPGSPESGVALRRGGDPTRLGAGDGPGSASGGSVHSGSEDRPLSSRADEGSRPRAAQPLHNDRVRADAIDYVNQHRHVFGLPEYRPSKRIPFDQELSKRAADAFEAMPHAPQDPSVKAAYAQFAKEIQAQYEHMLSRGNVTPEPWLKPGQPYANSAEMRADVANNHHLWFFPTVSQTQESSFGATGGDLDPEHNPLVRRTGHTLNGYRMTLNDMFRALHDYYGHAQTGNEFGPAGETNAWAEHAKMFSPLARLAMSSETHGQNSWVNSGKHLRRPDGSLPQKGDPDYIHPKDRPFSEQKVNILPHEVMPKI